MPSERARRRVGILTLACSIGAAAACAPRPLQLPSGAGIPLPDFAAIHADAARHCAGVRTVTAELGLSGRAGGARIRGRALAGFEAPGSMRLEGLAPFGAPAFILAARNGPATLLLPRDHRVLRGAPADEILGALTGVSLAPADLQAILTGCIVPSPTPVAGTQYGQDWRAIDLTGGARVYLRRSGGAWQVRAAERGPWRIEYAPWRGSFPQSIRLHRAGGPSAPASQGVDVTVSVRELEANTPIESAAFEVDVPPDAAPITLEELRDAGPLRGTDTTPE